MDNHRGLEGEGYICVTFTVHWLCMSMHVFIGVYSMYLCEIGCREDLLF